jgi:hypothetical protein
MKSRTQREAASHKGIFQAKDVRWLACVNSGEWIVKAGSHRKASTVRYCSKVFQCIHEVCTSIDKLIV